MKKRLFQFATAMTLIVAASQVQAGETTKPAPAGMHQVSITKNVQAKVLTNRLEEIQAMDPNALNKFEKRELRNEVKTIQSQLQRLDGGIYLSVGAVIVILLLLLILF